MEALYLYQKFEQLSIVAALVAQIVIGSLLGIGLIGNGLVIYISATSDRIINQPVHSLLVVNLAASDLVYLISSAPYQVMVDKTQYAANLLDRPQSTISTSRKLQM